MGISSNAQAIVELAKKNFGNEVYPIARGLIERIITFFYIQFCDENELANYIDYSKQKSFRKLDRNIRINDKTFTIKSSVSIDLSVHPNLRKAVEKFTSKNKKPITRWSRASLDKKLSIIDDAGIIDIALLMIALETIFDDGSEALHGTLYGCTFHLGTYDISSNTDDQEEKSVYHRGNLTAIFFLFACLLAEINLHVANNCGLTDIAELTTDTYEQIKDLITKSIGNKE